MEDWSGDFFKMLETLTEEVEQFFNDLAEEAIENFTKFSEEIIGQVDWSINEFDRNLETWFEPVYELLVDFEWQAGADFGTLDPPTDPASNQHTGCIGCRHYHGQSYGGNMLVCGMHPYGWDGEQCPDWES